MEVRRLYSEGTKVQKQKTNLKKQYNEKVINSFCGNNPVHDCL